MPDEPAKGNTELELEERLKVALHNVVDYYYKYEDEQKKGIILRKQLRDAGITPEV